MRISNKYIGIAFLFIVGCGSAENNNQTSIDDNDQTIECVKTSKSESEQCLHHYEKINGEYTVIVTGCYGDYSRVVANLVSAEYNCSNGKTYKTFCMDSYYVTEDNPEHDYVCRLYNADYIEFSSLNLADNDPMSMVVKTINTQYNRNNKDYSQMKQLWFFKGFNIQL
jgi:hypothetical protein